MPRHHQSPEKQLETTEEEEYLEKELDKMNEGLKHNKYISNETSAISNKL